MSSTSQSTGPDGPPDVHVDSKPSSGAKRSHPLLSATRLLLLAGPALPPAKQEAGVTVAAWSCCLLVLSCYLWTQKPKGPFLLVHAIFQNLVDATAASLLLRGSEVVTI